MAAITDPQAIAFVSQYARPWADKFHTALVSTPGLLTAWAAVSALIPNTADVVVDKASVNGVDATGGDGRRVLTGADVNALVTVAQAMRNFYLRGALAAGTADPTTYNIVFKPQVNGGPLF